MTEEIVLSKKRFYDILMLDKNTRYPGETGLLYLTAQGVIHRNLTWARFIDGQAQVVTIGTHTPDK